MVEAMRYEPQALLAVMPSALEKLGAKEAGTQNNGNRARRVGSWEGSGLVAVVPKPILISLYETNSFL